MPLSVRLDEKIERIVKRLAKKKNRTMSEVIREGIAVLAKKESVSESPSRPYEAVAHLIGSVRGGPPDLSRRTGERFREVLLARQPRR